MFRNRGGRSVMHTVADNIQKARINKSMSQQELASVLNVDRSTITGWETGRRIPDLYMLKRLCEVLDVSILSIIDEGDHENEKLLVIIVDDESTILDYNASVLAQTVPNAKIMCFTRPSKAIEFAKEHSIDLAFLDIEMGKTNGLDVCRELLEINKKTAVVFLTAYMEYSFDAWTTGASGYLIKPLKPDAIKTQLSLLKYR